MPSRHESQGMVVLEAATYGLPALGSAVGTLADLAPAAAYALAPDDVAALAGAAARLLDSPEQRQALGEAARVEVERRYASGPVVRTWLRVYGEALMIGGD
jgi:glycosyltransferase involved in cell wall biosynthesis